MCNRYVTPEEAEMAPYWQVDNANPWRGQQEVFPRGARPFVRAGSRTHEFLQTYTMLTINADGHKLMSRMHEPDPTLSPDGQDKRSVVSIELADVDQWLFGSIEDIAGLVRVEVIEAGPGAESLTSA